MKLETKKAIFIKRYKRFFAETLYEGKKLECHLPNTGSLKSCLFENAPCLISKSPNPNRKLKYTLEMIQTPTGWAGVNTQNPNKLVYECFVEKKIKDWSKFPFIHKEVRVNEGKTRIDFALSHKEDKITSLELEKNKFHFIEVKNVSLKEKNTAYFPDSPTERGKKHLLELMDLCEKGHSAELFFVIQRQNCNEFKTADEIDPEYGKLLKQACKKGLFVRALAFEYKNNLLYLNTEKNIKWIK